MRPCPYEVETEKKDSADASADTPNQATDASDETVVDTPEETVDTERADNPKEGE